MKLPLPSPGTQRVLAAWMSPRLFGEYVQEIEGPRPPGLREGLSKAHDALQRLPPNGPPAGIGALDDEGESAWIESLRAQPQWEDAQFGRVLLRDLLVFQPFLHPYPQQAPDTSAGILGWCLPKRPSVGEWDVEMGEPGVFDLVQNDPRPEWRLPEIVTCDDEGREGVLFTLAPNVNVVVAGQLKSGRMVVLNGVHRLVSLAAMGEVSAPALIEPHADEFLRRAGRWFDAEVLQLPRPPTIPDFLDPTLTLDLPRREQRVRFRIRWTVTRILEPLPRS